MAFIFGLILILLGVVGMHATIAQKVPAARESIDKIVQYKSYIGMAGIVFGIFWAFDWIMHIGILIHLPLLMIVDLIALLLCLGLGLIFGLDAVKSEIKDPPPPILVKAEAARARITGYQNEMSMGALVIGLLYWFILLVY